jgi:hypothetical protein
MMRSRRVTLCKEGIVGEVERRSRDGEALWLMMVLAKVLAIMWF